MYLEILRNSLNKRQQDLNKRLEQIVEEVMGDTPINLASGADMTKVVYSREVIDRNKP